MNPFNLPSANPFNTGNGTSSGASPINWNAIQVSNPHIAPTLPAAPLGKLSASGSSPQIYNPNQNFSTGDFVGAVGKGIDQFFGLPAYLASGRTVPSEFPAQVQQAISESGLPASKQLAPAFGAIAGAIEPIPGGFPEGKILSEGEKITAAVHDLYTTALKHTIDIPVSQIKITPETITAAKDVAAGTMSKSNLPILVQKNPEGMYEVLDGKHRLADLANNKGAQTIQAITNESVYRGLAEKETALQEQALTHAQAIKAAQEGADMQANMSIENARSTPSTAEYLKANEPKPVQPRQANGWWDAFKNKFNDQRGMIRNPLAPGEEPHLPEGEHVPESSGNDTTINPPEDPLLAGEPHPASGETQVGQETPNTPTSVGSLEELNQSRQVPASAKPTTDFKYVKEEPLNIGPKGSDKATAADIRAEYAGVKNEQIVRGNQLADDLRKAAPKEQDGMFWYKAAKGDTEVLTKLLSDEKFKPYKAGIEQALNLSPEAKAALTKGDQYYKEAGQVAKETGTIGTIRDEYMNRMYTKEPEKDFVKTEMGQGLKQTTSHAKQRVYESEIDAVNGGKTFATTNYADALSIHNEEMARVNTARRLMDTMEKGGLGAWTDHPASGWQQVGSLRKGTQIFSAPKGIAEGMKAIADPDFLKQVDGIKSLQKYQGFLKSVDLAYSFFHHFTFVTQALSSKNGLSTLSQMVVGGLKMEAPAFKAMEIDFVRHGGMTTHVSQTQDIMRGLSQGNDNIAKLLRMPVGKQMHAVMEASNRFLFEKMQRFLKVMTYQKNMAAWTGKHPLATDEAVKAAKQGYAKATNAVYGGLNWQQMGATKSVQSVLRTIFLAPDWLTSAGSLTKYAISDTGTAGQQARYTLTKAVIGGMVITEGVNKLITGHFTDQNPKGHTMEVQVAPNVYVPLVRGAPGELIKLLSKITTNGPLQGTSSYLQGKLAPLMRTGLGLFTGVNYAGQSIYQGGKHPNPLSKTFGGLMYVLQNTAPIPFGVTSGMQELQSGQATPAGVAFSMTGLGRYSAPPKAKAGANPFSI